MDWIDEKIGQMRREVVADREELWRRIEAQKEINAASAHDMRTPLTVLRGYTELLYRYAPEGKISEEKLLSTLKLMSEHLNCTEINKIRQMRYCCWMNRCSWKLWKTCFQMHCAMRRAEWRYSLSIKKR